jgi:murein DD-endopeptidase MepM/ murein hydrolase activator NlpD/GH25 family lysozyme M1 (1,4-beta-N-acetylmuramidase)
MKPIIDLSVHEGTIDFVKLAPLVSGAILRLGYGEQKDAKLEEYYAGATAANIPLAGYHFPIDQRTVGSQIEKVSGWINGKYFRYGIVVDVETPSPQHTQSKNMIDAYLSALKGKLGVKPMIYTSEEMWKRIMGAGTPYYTEYPLWAANYAEAGPALPLGATVWTLWQYSEEGRLDGSSSYLDLNNYNIPLVAKLEPVNTIVDELKRPLGKLITTNTTLKLAVRMYPISGAIVRWLDAGSTVEYYENKVGWYRIGFDEWITGYWVRVLEVYATNPIPEPEPEPSNPTKYLFEAKIATTYDWLPVREAPGMNSKEVGRLVNGDLIKVLEANKDRWYRIGDKQWVYGNNCYSLQEPLKSLAYPMEKEFRISQLFGVATGAYASSNGHNGIDYACYGGTKLIASADGFVETVELTTTYGYGRHVRIRVQGGVLIYGHMLEIYVKLGDRIKEGQVIGLSDGAVGMPYAGNTTGNHLHFEYRLDRPIVPEGYGNRKYWAINTLSMTRPWKAV